MDASRLGLTQEQDAPRGVDAEEVFQPRPCFLAASARLLFRWIDGARDGSFGAGMTKRGRAAGGATGTAADRADAKGTGGHASPRHWRKALTLRQGASPKVRKVFRSTGSKTMHPWRRFGLAHAEQAPMQQVHRMLLEVDEHAQETIFRCWQGTVRIGWRASRLPTPSMQGPYGHGVQERCRKRRHQSRKLVHGQTRQIEDLGGMGWNIEKGQPQCKTEKSALA